MSTIVIIIIAILWHIILGFSFYIYHKHFIDRKDAELNKLDFEHESELKELEKLFHERVREYDSIIKKYEDDLIKFQSYYKNFTEIIRISNDKISEIDSKGSFKSDDEVGFFFNNLKEIQASLNAFDFTRPIVKKDDPVKEGPILPDGKGNVIVITQEEADKILNDNK